MSGAFRDRYLDVLASVYLYNEHRGYTSLDRVLEAVRLVCPDDPAFIAEIVQHRADEHKHYHMFRRWFERQGRMPLAMDRRVGHIDRFIFRTFGCEIDELDTAEITANPAEFEKLCRVIMLTEQRGYRQVEILLANGWVRSDPIMTRIFQIVHKDEPGHFLPYQHWLERKGRATARWQERLSDFWIHRALLFGRIPALFLNPALPRLERWPHEDDAAPAKAA
ncbi:ferritin-like domain-containing protein [Novosphingobium flavum]|uniref:Ferritin-like domain-containing protein n=1 Tax=Novosphingobium flavum TaxID=1778672 RepID=A0A7X1FQJ0_9SPHN|nr:ferritin-like domain-containing protein [Novosphingobium flavum]